MLAPFISSAQITPIAAQVTSQQLLEVAVREQLQRTWGADKRAGLKARRGARHGAHPSGDSAHGRNPGFSVDGLRFRTCDSDGSLVIGQQNHSVPFISISKTVKSLLP